MKNLALVFFVLMFNNLFAQIDTTDWYPLHIGDKWEYYGQGFGYSQVEVIGDTLMPNGKTYFILTLYDRKYQRVDSSRYVMVYNEYTNDNEYVRFDLLGDKGDIFTLAPSNTGGYFGDGVYETGIDNNNLIMINREWKEYREVFIDTTVTPIDTIWNETVDTYWPRVTKGLGVTSYDYDLTILVGAVIDGVGYGTLVDVEDDIYINIPNVINLYQNYPNPFNASTIIRYEIADSRYESQNINLSVYNTLGQKVEDLVSKAQKPGFYEVTFDGETLISGIYFIQLTTGEYQKTIKAILLK